jgi:RNA polymerase sigma-70 factor (ECF subfamily)
MANRDDQHLIRCSLDGHSEAFGQLVCKYQDRLYNGLVQILRSESDAEDAVQDAFVLAFTKLDSFKGNSQFFTWLYRIGYNVAISKIRRRKQTLSLSSSECGERKFDFADDGPAPADRMEQDEDSRQLTAALDRLSEDHRSILVLREMEEMDYDAISAVLDLPVGTVRSRLHRARSALREELESIINRS